LLISLHFPAMAYLI